MIQPMIQIQEWVSYKSQSFFIMKAAYEEKFLVNMNTIEEGLNFIVPSEWWKDFEQANQHIKCYKEMRLNGSYPLDYLFETSVIELSTPSWKRSFQQIVKEADGTLTSIQRQIKEAEKVDKNQGGVKRGKIPCQWMLQIQEVDTKDVDLLLCGPRINQQMAELFQVRNQSWTVVSPELYRLIYEQEVKQKRLELQPVMIGIPVLIPRTQPFYIGEAINYTNLKYMEIFIKNTHGKTFSFLGYVDQDVKFKKLLRWINEGMFRLCVEGRQKFIFKKKNILLKVNDCNSVIFYELYDEPSIGDLDWSEFSTFSSTKIGQSAFYKLIAFSGGKGGQKEKEGGQLQASFRKISKGFEKVFKTEDGSYITRTMISPIIIQGEDRPQVQANDVHYSTQEQTPSNPEQRDQFMQLPHYSVGKSQRISFPIWKDPCPENLHRLAHIRSAIPKIAKPHCDQGTIIIKDDGRKITLPKETNQVAQDDEGLLKEQETLQKIVNQSDAPSEAVARQLELLAQEILGMKIMEFEEEKEKQVDFAKQNKSEYEDMTCKNEFMDEFDCEESRDNFE